MDTSLCLKLRLGKQVDTDLGGVEVVAVLHPASTATTPSSYQFSTTVCGAGRFISICAVTFWICDACSFRLALRV